MSENVEAMMHLTSLRKSRIRKKNTGCHQGITLMSACESEDLLAVKEIPGMTQIASNAATTSISGECENHFNAKVEQERNRHKPAAGHCWLYLSNHRADAKEFSGRWVDPCIGWHRGQTTKNKSKVNVRKRWSNDALHEELVSAWQHWEKSAGFHQGIAQVWAWTDRKWPSHRRLSTHLTPLGSWARGGKPTGWRGKNKNAKLVEWHAKDHAGVYQWTLDKHVKSHCAIRDTNPRSPLKRLSRSLALGQGDQPQSTPTAGVDRMQPQCPTLRPPFWGWNWWNYNVLLG